APHVVAVGAGIANDGRIDGRPIRVAGDAALVADPADVGPRVGEDHGLRLVLPHEIPDSWPIVGLTAAVGPFAVRAVEPDLVYGTVLCEQLGELRTVQIVVTRRIAVRRLVSVPRREIQTGFESFGVAGVNELAHDVALTVAPRTPRDRVVGRLRLPEAESVVVLCGENHRAEARRARGPRPLPRVERRRREDARVFAAVAPLAIGEGVDAEVQEERELIPLPLELWGRRRRASRADRPTSRQECRRGGSEESPARRGRMAQHA